MNVGSSEDFKNLRAFHNDVVTLCEDLGILVEHVVDEKTLYSKSVEIKKIEEIVKKFRDISHPKQTPTAAFWEHEVNEKSHILTQIKEKPLRALTGYSKDDLKVSIEFISSLLMREVNALPGTPLESVHSGQTHYLPLEYLRNGLHTLLKASASAKIHSASLKKQYSDEFKSAYQAAKKVYAELSDMDKRSLKPQFDTAVKVLKHYHKKYKS